MLIFSGVGSMTAPRFAADPRRGIALACGSWCWSGAAMADRVAAAAARIAGLAWPVRPRCSSLLIAPVSLALGLPFPLGLERAGNGGFLPWAWGLNGAFSVVATPLANLIAREAGFSRVLLGAAVLYVIAYIAFPLIEKELEVAASTGALTRRGLISAAAALSVVRPGLRRGAAWTREAYEQAMQRSGRPVSLTDAQFDAIQSRKPAAMKRIESYLQEPSGLRRSPR